MDAERARWIRRLEECSFSTQYLSDSECIDLAAFLKKSAPVPELGRSDDLKRLRELEHAVWHALDDSEERGEGVLISTEDANELAALVGEDHPGNADPHCQDNAPVSARSLCCDGSGRPVAEDCCGFPITPQAGAMTGTSFEGLKRPSSLDQSHPRNLSQSSASVVGQVGESTGVLRDAGASPSSTGSTSGACALPYEAKQAVAEALYELMSDISEDCYCARWMMGNEFRLWDALTNPDDDRRYGQDSITDEQVRGLRVLSDLAGGWWKWDHHKGRVFVNLEDWRSHVATTRSATQERKA